MHHRERRVLACTALIGCLAACSANQESPTPYTPGLGEIMTLTQMRHAKLWYAGEAGNWGLASYELDELEEGFADARKFHPTHKDAPQPLAQVLPIMVDAPIAAVRIAVDRHDKTAFETAFDALTDGCNACHRTMKFGFNVVQRPATNAFPNQSFAPATPRPAAP
jgi:hypothetical protein